MANTCFKYWPCKGENLLTKKIDEYAPHNTYRLSDYGEYSPRLRLGEYSPIIDHFAFGE